MRQNGRNRIKPPDNGESLDKAERRRAPARRVGLQAPSRTNLATSGGKGNAHSKPWRASRSSWRGSWCPLEDDPSSVSEFLLVPVLGSCIHTPPPPPNQIVQVRFASGTHARVEWEETVLLQGKSSVSASESPFGPVGFQKTNARVTRNRSTDPLIESRHPLIGLASSLTRFVLQQASF